MNGLPTSSRRRLLGMVAALPVLMRAERPQAATVFANTMVTVPFTQGVSLLVAGPNGGNLARWADILQPALEQSLPPDTSVHRVEVGGADGVTGANQFEARGVPDGLTVLLGPGEAALAWLVGDPRAQFDVGHWLPVMACMTPGIVVVRPAADSKDRVLRVAASGPGGPDLPGLLGLDLLGIRSTPVFGLIEQSQRESAFLQGAVDAVVLRGYYVQEQVTASIIAGGQPLCTFGACDEAGNLMRDAAFPDVPHLTELAAVRYGRALSGPLYNAWRASAVASQLEFGLMLRQLTPAAMVSLWRSAAVETAGSLAVQAKALSLNERSLGGAAATATITAAAVDAVALTELRRWLAGRFNWRPT